MPRKRLRVKRHTVTQPSDPSYRLIPLTQGQNAMVDTADFEWLSQWNWHAAWNPCKRSFNAVRHEYGNISVPMHREILKADDSVEVDHKNHDCLDNRRANIRVCAKAKNAMNRRVWQKSISGYKGVTLFEDRIWRARIRFNGKLIHLGLFTSAREAARVYDKAARKYFGEFAFLNFPNSLDAEL